MLRHFQKVTAAICLAVCVALSLFWVRSYRTADQLQMRTRLQRGMMVASKQGRLVFVRLRNWPTATVFESFFSHFPVHDVMSFPLGDARQYDAALGFGWLERPSLMVSRSTFETPLGGTIYISGAASAKLDGWGLSLPFWFLVMTTGGLGLALCRERPWRMSMRGMFVAMTVIAIVLWLVAAFDKSPKNWELDEPVPLDVL